MSKQTLPVSKAIRLHREKIPPGPHGLRLLSTMRAFHRDPLRAVSAMMHEHGDVVHAHFLFWDIYLITHPDGVKHVLQENQRNSSKDILWLSFLRTLLGNGLFTSDGAGLLGWYM